MSDTFDHYGDALDADFLEDPRGVTCKRCGATDLYWQEVFAADGLSEKSVLFEEGGHRHVCKPSADDFEVVG